MTVQNFVKDNKVLPINEWRSQGHRHAWAWTHEHHFFFCKGIHNLIPIIEAKTIRRYLFYTEQFNVI